jgi:rSAM/selenodomain-associated transferase 2
MILKNKEFKLSIVIPVLSESEQIERCLNGLQLLRQRGHEVIVVDGGSNDDTVLLALPLCDRVIQSEKSRAIQMNSGAANATGHCILFLHADTILPPGITDLFLQLKNIEKEWGHFDIKLSGRNCLFRIIETCMNIRSRLTGIATGDQTVFVGKDLFNEINGFPEIALMEDIAISRILIKHSKPVCFREKVVSSSRRWEENGILKTILKMWVMRLLYFFHFDTDRLAKIYSS